MNDTCNRLIKRTRGCRIFVAALVLVLVTTACGFQPPVTKIQTGPAQTSDLQVPLPVEPSNLAELNLEIVAGDLILSPEPAASGYLASGTATYNSTVFEPRLEGSGYAYTLRQGAGEFKSIPVNQDDLMNTWDLQLANTPMRLSIDAGPYTGRFELGGLALEKLTISEAGSDVTCAFSAPNQVEMSSFTYDTGGSILVLTGLANANFAQMSLTAGAGDYTLSFDGDLQRDASVMIEAGMGTVNLILPEGVQAQLTFEGGLTGVNIYEGWEQQENGYTHAGSGPTLSITIKMDVGTLNLKTG